MKLIKSTLFAMLATLVFVAGAWADSDEGDSDKKAAVEALRQADIAWSALSNSKEFDTSYANWLDDAMFLVPNAPAIEGRAAIKAMLDNLRAMPGFSLKWQVTLVEVSSSGDLGYTIGTYVMTIGGPDGEPVVDNGKYLTAWKKGADGSWKVAADIFNTNMPLPSTEDEG